MKGLLAMTYLFFIAVLVIAAIALLCIKGLRLFAGVPVVLGLLLTAWSALWVIPEGQTGATRFLGSVNETAYPGGQGLVFINPIADRYTYETRARLAQFRGESALEMTLGRGGVFTLEAGVPFTVNGSYAPALLAQTSFTIDDAAANAIRAGFRDVAQRYATYEQFSNRRQGLGQYADLPPLEAEIRQLAQGHMDEFFFRSSGIEPINGAPVISVGAVQIRAVTPSPAVQAAANEYEAELTALQTAQVQRERAAIEAERVGAIVPALEAIAQIIPEGQSAEGFAAAINAAAQLRLTEAMARSYAATADALADADRGINPTIIISGGGSGAPVPTLPIGTQ